MKISQIALILDAEFISGEELKELEIENAYACDLMSDVLDYVRDSEGVLLTGLTNPQVVRTARMMEVRCIVFVRNKMPDEKTVQLAKEDNIAILKCSHTMFTACGLLYGSGIRGEED